MKRLKSGLVSGALSAALLFSGLQGFSAESTSREEFVASLKEAPLSELPDLSNHEGTPLAVAIDIVASGTALILYNQMGSSRVFYDGKLPEDLSTIRVAAVYASIPGLVDDGEWNWYIKKDAGQHVEIEDQGERSRIIDYVNENPKDGSRDNIHMLRM